MKSLPLPIRLAAGLAATAVERVSKLPEGIAGLPVTVASQALQFSMRVQQHVTELAIKGDEALAGLRPVEDKPEWATFDEDEDETGGAEVHEFLRREAKVGHESPPGRGWDVAKPNRPSSPTQPLSRDTSTVHAQAPVPVTDGPTIDEAKAVEPEQGVPVQPEQARTTSGASGPRHAADPSASGTRPSGETPAVAGFDDWSVAQLRGKLRTLTLQQLEELLEYERTHQARERFVTMLGNRVRTVREATD